jgi:mannitol/fructose-specific phosphotransferase system IIA component (Ntr-type)
MKLASLLQREHVLTGRSAGSYAEAREMLLGRLREETGCALEPLRDALDERQALGTPVVAPGIAFPHARVEAVDDLYILIGTFPGGVPAPAAEAEPGPEPVRLIVLYLLPEGMSNLYLRAMASFSRMLRTDGALEALVAAPDPEALIARVEEAGVMVKDVATAADIMTREPVTLAPGMTLREAADLMVKNGLTWLPVVDPEGTYAGHVSARRLLRVGLPDYLLDMESLDFLTDFEPFQDLIKQEQSTTVGEIANPEGPRFEAETPMIVVAARLLREEHGVAPVLAGERLIGVIGLLDFVHKVVRA